MARRTSAQTRAEILRVADELFRERGYAQTSVRDIAAAAASDPALVIRHFGSKESLFLEAVGAQALARPLFGGGGRPHLLAVDRGRPRAAGGR